MRSIFITVALIVVGCAQHPYFDLRHPIYLVTEKSFWNGCDKDPTGLAVCRENRIKQIYAGIDQWFNYFETTSRPKAIVVLSDKELPGFLENDVIYLGISKDFCEHNWATACYASEKFLWFTKTSIVFKNSNFIGPGTVPHEWGHTLGRGDNDVKRGVGSVMSYTHPTVVTPADFIKMCKMHKECVLRLKKRKK